MDWQSAFNTAMALVAFLGGWMIKWIGDSLKSLKDSNKEMKDNIQKIEVLVAGEYVKKTDLEKATDLYNAALKEFSASLREQLTRIEDKLDNKADK
jgi:hypothetical protein